MAKYCTRCLEDKDLSDFNKCSSAPDGLQFRCKPCCAEASKASRLKRLEADPTAEHQAKKAWYQANRELSIQRAKQYRLDHPEWAKEVDAKRNATNPTKTWRERNPDKAKTTQKRQTLKRKLDKYNLSPEQFLEMQALQEGKCAICEIVPPDGLVIDHNHSTNKVRELLCNRCNPAIGMIGEDPNIARKIINYLAKHNTDTASS